MLVRGSIRSSLPPKQSSPGGLSVEQKPPPTHQRGAPSSASSPSSPTAADLIGPALEVRGRRGPSPPCLAAPSSRVWGDTDQSEGRVEGGRSKDPGGALSAPPAAPSPPPALDLALPKSMLSKGPGPGSRGARNPWQPGRRDVEAEETRSKKTRRV